MQQTERITIHIDAGDLRQIDLLVELGHFDTRTDLIEQAVRYQLDEDTQNAEDVKSFKYLLMV